eukprot:scaffold604178_cov17-Prasinocladus_malaysianus.AAC.1
MAQRLFLNATASTGKLHVADCLRGARPEPIIVVLVLVLVPTHAAAAFLPGSYRYVGLYVHT